MIQKTKANRITKTIQKLNDTHRQHIPFTRVMLSATVSKLNPPELSDVIEAVRDYNDFNQNNDFYQEHDFGKITVNGKNYFWKIDYYDKNLQYLSPAPENCEITERVLTIMASWEY